MSDIDAANPQAGIEQRIAARHLLQRPLTCAEHDPDLFRLIRRHESTLDRWFTQRLGYRLHVDTDTARLYKTTYQPADRPLRVTGRSERALRPLEYTMLALVFATTAAGPSVISLRDLIAEVRSAAAEAEIDLSGDTTERRAFVTALQWMIGHGLVTELYNHVDSYTTDDDADAILKIRPDRIALVPVPTLAATATPDELIDQSQRRTPTRQWLRSRLAEDPVIYPADLTDGEWGELRRRLGDDAALLEESFGLVLETRSEGVAAIDPTGTLSDRRFPTGGTEGHAALLLLEELTNRRAPADGWVPFEEIVTIIEHMTVTHSKKWRNELVEHPERLANTVVELLVDLRLAESSTEEGPRAVRLLPAAARYTLDVPEDAERQAALW